MIQNIPQNIAVKRIPRNCTKNEIGFERKCMLLIYKKMHVKYRTSVVEMVLLENVWYIHKLIFAMAKKMTKPRPVLLSCENVEFERRFMPSIRNGVWINTCTSRKTGMQMESVSPAFTAGTILKMKSMKNAGCGMKSRISSIRKFGSCKTSNLIVCA